MKINDYIRILLSIGLIIGMWLEIKWCLYLSVTLVFIGAETVGWLLKWQISLTKKSTGDSDERKK